MTDLYKLTDSRSQTKHEMQWGEGVTNGVTNPTSFLCTPGVIHAYRGANLAILMAPIHVSFNKPRLYLAEGCIIVDDGTKVGCHSLTTVREMSLPIFSTEQKVSFAIQCALLVYADKGFIAWANKWLSGEDRSNNAAEYATCAAEHATARAATCAAEHAAARAAEYATCAAEHAADAAAHAACAAEYAADAAAHAAGAADIKNINISDKILEISEAL